MAREAFAWAAFIALGCGIVAGLGVLYSAKRTFALAVASVLIQMAAWMAFFLIAGAEPREGTADWQTDLWAGFLFGLLVAAPYTVIGSVLSGTVVGLLRWKRRRSRAGVCWPPGRPPGNGQTSRERR